MRALVRWIAAAGVGLAFPTPAPADTAAHSASVIVTFTGFRDDSGHLLAEIFNRADGFPTNPDRALARVQADIVGGVAHVAFDNLPAGDYAVVGFHDENGDYVLQKNWLGIPTEGIAVSNDASHLTGPPHFDEARFVVPEGGRSLTMAIKYH